MKAMKAMKAIKAKIIVFCLVVICVSLVFGENLKENLDYLFEGKFPISDYIWGTQKTHIKQSQNPNQTSLDSAHKTSHKKMFVDKDGNTLYIDEFGNVYDKDGNLIGKALLDANGNPILGKDGKPIIYDKDGRILGTNDSVLRDSFGNVILDANGNPIFIDKNGNLKDIYGNLITDSNGKPINIKDKKALQDFIAQNTKNALEMGIANSITRDIQQEQERLQKELQAQNLTYKESSTPTQKATNLDSSALESSDTYRQKLQEQEAKEREQRLIQERKYQEEIFYKAVVLGERMEGNGSVFAQQNLRYGDGGFSNQKSIDIATNEHKLYRMIRAGRLIPAVLMTPIVSNIEGIITAQVEQDIYAAQGRAVLIPRGTKVVGFYKNDNKIGQSRLSIVWREMITPQGVNILLTNAMSADSRGINGVEGYLDNKFSQRYGLGLFLNTLSNGLMISISNLTQKNGTTTSPYTAQLFSNAQGDINNIFKQLIQEQSKIKPTIEIRAGSRIYITPTTHIWFPIPKNGEVMMQYFNDEYQ